RATQNAASPTAKRQLPAPADRYGQSRPRARRSRASERYCPASPSPPELRDRRILQAHPRTKKKLTNASLGSRAVHLLFWPPPPRPSEYRSPDAHPPPPTPHRDR